ncbi:fumarate hydratase, partial [Treponema sp. OttesenSCG-928-L16]|nr:fumarate hydratase [Treponema sp. OttesenSCG-928-L16]
MDFRNSISAAFDNTRFDTIESNCQRPCVKDGRLTVPPALLRELSEEAFRQLSFYFRESHLELLGRAFSHSGASDNDRLVISSLLKNAVIASKGELALCQDTGTAIIYGWKDESIYTGCDDGEE